MTTSGARPIGNIPLDRQSGAHDSMQMGTDSACAKGIDQRRSLAEPGCGRSGNARGIAMISQAAHRIVAWTGSLASAVLLILVAEQSVLAACVGDCSDDGNVSINDLISGVNIALDTLPLTACQPLDADMNGDVTVNELIIA